MNGPVCAILPDSQRAPDWAYVFRRLDNIPITSWLPETGMIDGLGPQLIYLLDLTRVTREERARLVSHIAERFAAPAAEVDHQLDHKGLPLLATDLVVAIPLRLLM